MNPLNPNDGILPKPKRRGRPPKEIETLEDEEKRANLSDSVPEGPYQTKAQRWDAYRKILDLQTIREKRGKGRIAEWKIAEYIGVPYYEFEKEIFSTAFQNYRIAKASMQIMATLADIAPSLRLTLLDLAEELQNDKGHDAKKQREFVALVSNVMEKFGIQKFDISHADSSQEMDTDEAIQEGLRIVQELKGHEEIVQWFTKVSTDTGKRERKAAKTRGDSGLPEDHSANGPDPALETVRVRQAAPEQSEEVPVDDRAEPVVKD